MSDEKAWAGALKQNPEAGNTQSFMSRPSRWPEKYVVRVFDRSGTHEMNRSAQSENFEQILRDVRSIATQYHQRDYFTITLQNDNRVDQGFDGLTDEERDQFQEALAKVDNTPRPAATPTTSPVEGHVGPGGPPNSKRSLRDNPALDDIDGRIRALDTMRSSLTNADRAPWSVLSDLHREAEALVSAIRRARRQL